MSKQQKICVTGMAVHFLACAVALGFLLVSLFGCAGLQPLNPDKDQPDPTFRFMCAERAVAAGLGLRFQLGLDLADIVCFRGARLDPDTGKVIGHAWCAGRVFAGQCGPGKKCLVPYMLKNGFGYPDWRQTQQDLADRYQFKRIDPPAGDLPCSECPPGRPCQVATDQGGCQTAFCRDGCWYAPGPEEENLFTFLDRLSKMGKRSDPGQWEYAGW